MKDTKDIDGNFFCHLGHAQGVELGGCLGAKIKFGPAVYPLCYLLLNHWTKFNQIRCMSYSHEWACNGIFFAPPTGALGRGQKVIYYFISITNTISKCFIPNFECVLTNERYKTHQTGFLFCCLGHAPGVGLFGAGGGQVVKNLFFSNMVMWHIKLTWMTSRTECK